MKSLISQQQNILQQLIQEFEKMKNLDRTQQQEYDEKYEQLFNRLDQQYSQLYIAFEDYKNQQKICYEKLQKNVNDQLNVFNKLVHKNISQIQDNNNKVILLENQLKEISDTNSQCDNELIILFSNILYMGDLQEQQIGYGITDFLKKHKILSKAMNFLEKSGLQDQILDKLPIPGVIKNYGKQGLQKLSNHLKQKGYGQDLFNEIDYYMLPESQINDIKGYGIQELKNSTKKLNQIYDEIYKEIQNIENKQKQINQLQNEINNTEKQQKIVIKEKKFKEDNDEIIENKQQQVVIKDNRNDSETDVQKPKKFRIRKKKEKDIEKLQQQLKVSYNDEFIEKEDSQEIIQKYINDEISYNDMQKQLSTLKKSVEKQIKEQQKQQKKKK